MEHTLEAHGLQQQPPQFRVLERGHQRPGHVSPDCSEGGTPFHTFVEFLRISRKVDDPEHIGRDGKEKNCGVGAADKNQRRRHEHRHRRSEFAPGTRIAVIFGPLVEPTLETQPCEDHGLVGARSERLPHPKQEHGHEQQRQLLRQTKYQKARDVRKEGKDHRLAASKHVGDGTRGDLEENHRHLTEGDQPTDVEEREAFFEKCQQQERLKIPLVLQKTVEAESSEHRFRLHRHDH